MFTDIVGWMLDNPEVGWVVVILYLGWEIRGPKGAVHEMRSTVNNTIVVIRALARVHEEVDTERVDEYLVDNGSEPGDFIDIDFKDDDDDEDDVSKVIKSD